MTSRVAIVGRPNVGKSTLVNRLAGVRTAIVEERPGVTRDRKVVPVEWTGRSFEVVDTGGWLPGGSTLDEKVSRQAEKAMDDADIVIFVVDGTTGVTEDDAASRRGVAAEVEAGGPGGEQDRRSPSRAPHLGVHGAGVG